MKSATQWSTVYALELIAMTVDTHFTPAILNDAEQIDLDQFPCEVRDRAASLRDELELCEMTYNGKHPDNPMRGDWPRGMHLLFSLVFASSAVVFGLLASHMDGPLRPFAALFVGLGTVAAVGCAAMAAMGEQISRIAALKEARKFYKQIAPRHDEILRELDRLAATKGRPGQSH